MDPALIFGHDGEERLVAVEVLEDVEGGDNVAAFFRGGGGVSRRDFRLDPFLILESPSLLDGGPKPSRVEDLSGPGRYRALAFYPSWKSLQHARTWLSKRSGSRGGEAGGPFLQVNDPGQQALMLTGRTLFKGMAFEDVRRMQVDIETHTAPGFEFCNPERESDRIIIIALSDSEGWTEIMEERSGDEARLLRRFAEAVRARDPDVIEGHNIFKFDLPYLAARARRHRVKLALGRDGSAMTSRASRFTAGDRTIPYPRFEVFGRHIVDTFFLVQLYDVATRSLDSYGLKQAAAHFKLSAPGRTHIEGSEIAGEYARDPGRVLRYAGDDVRETRLLSDVLSRTYFAQTQMLPMTFQSVCVRGNAGKIDALMLREYLRRRHAVPSPGAASQFAGGATEVFVRGVVRNVHHCDVRSLYPSLMLARRIAPAGDDLGVFLQLLEFLRSFRLDAKKRMAGAADDAARRHWESLQAAFKILINSFYGYLGFAQALFNDFDAAARVTAGGRALMADMLEWLRAHGATPIELDTDGIYFVPPAFGPDGGRDRFRRGFEASLPPGIEVEFDGEYESMFSYKMKNYALLEPGGGVIVRGAALKSRGIEPYLRALLNEYVRLKLNGREAEAPALFERYEQCVRGRSWPIRMLAKTETLRDAPAAYAAKVGGSGRGRNAAYELALKSGRDYQAGDQVSYYIAGDKKSVAAHSAARLVAEWDPAARDENVEYYAAKIKALARRLEAGGEGDDGADGESEGG